MKIENKKIIIEITDTKWTQYVNDHRGDAVAARGRVLAEAMKKLAAMANPMQPIPDFVPEYFTVERVHGTCNSPGYSVRAQTKSDPILRSVLERMHEESHGGGRYAHLHVIVK